VYALGVAANRAVTGIYPPPGVDLARAVDPSLPPQPALQPPEKLATVCREAGEVAQAFEQAAERAGSKNVEIELTPGRSDTRSCWMEGSRRWVPRQA
jgi:hypothetical protein